MNEAAWEFPFFPNSSGREFAKDHTFNQLQWVQRVVELRIEASREGLLTDGDRKMLATAVEEAVTQAEEFEAYVLAPAAMPHPYSHVQVAGVAALNIAEKVATKEDSTKEDSA